MKAILTFLFIVSASSLFAHNSVVIPTTVLKNEKEVKTLVQTVSNQATTTLNAEKTIAFECYYTMEWLYKECPFVEKFEAFA